jgi:hypothetical protein
LGALQTTLPLVKILLVTNFPPRNRAGFWMLVFAAALVILCGSLAGDLGICELAGALSPDAFVGGGSHVSKAYPLRSGNT